MPTLSPSVSPAGNELWTASQEAALRVLKRNFAVKCLPPCHGSLKIRTHTLLVGPTGVGKSAIVQRFAEKSRLPLFTVACNSWIPHGALAKPGTLELIAQFLGQPAPDGGRLIFLDEVDKVVPAEDAYNSSWNLGVFGEVLALLDGDGRLVNANWDEQHFAALRHTFIVGAGAFQQLATRQKESDNASRRFVGFTPVAEEPSVAQPHYSKRVTGEGLPPEIASRFAGDPVILTGPTLEEYAQGIVYVHAALMIRRPGETETQKLAASALASGQGMRWFECYALELLGGQIEVGMPKSPEPEAGAVPKPPERKATPRGKPIKPSSKVTIPEPAKSAAATERECRRRRAIIQPQTYAEPPAEWVRLVRPSPDWHELRKTAHAANEALSRFVCLEDLNREALAQSSMPLYPEVRHESGVVWRAIRLRTALTEYFDPCCQANAAHSHEQVFSNAHVLASSFERLFMFCGRELNDLGMGDVVQDVAARVFTFAVEWRICSMVSQPEKEEEELPW